MRVPHGRTLGAPSRKGPTVVASRAEMAVKKAGSGGYGDSDSKRQHEWAFSSIERRLRQAFYLTDRTPHSAGAQLKNASLCRRSNSLGPEPARKGQNMCASRRKASARVGNSGKGSGQGNASLKLVLSHAQSVESLTEPGMIRRIFRT